MAINPILAIIRIVTSSAANDAATRIIGVVGAGINLVIWNPTRTGAVRVGAGANLAKPVAKRCYTTIVRKASVVSS